MGGSRGRIRGQNFLLELPICAPNPGKTLPILLKKKV